MTYSKLHRVDQRVRQILQTDKRYHKLNLKIILSITQKMVRYYKKNNHNCQIVLTKKNHNKCLINYFIHPGRTNIKTKFISVKLLCLVFLRLL